MDDLTGGGDHFRAEVVSDRFEGLSRIQQHKLVYDVFGAGDRRRHPRALHQDLDTRSDTVNNDEIRDFIQQAIDENRVMLFMKGTPNQPACGFSARTAGALNALGVQYAALDILPDPRIREELSGLSGWPTIPQLFVNKELVGGSDIVMEMFESGELAELLGVEQPEERPRSRRPSTAAGAAADRPREPPGLVAGSSPRTRRRLAWRGALTLATPALDSLRPRLAYSCAWRL